MVRRSWLAESLSSEVEQALDRLERTRGVFAVAVMPDVHLARGVCIGTVTATREFLLPEAVGGDIGCGMCALRFDVPARALADRRTAAAVLGELSERIPIKRHGKGDGPSLAEELVAPLQAVRVERRLRRQVASQLGTLGRGNRDADHNHVQRERVDGRDAWVHRKGAQSASLGEAGMIPGSMGSASYHVTGRGVAAALSSSSHGAGRCMSRTEARQRIGRGRLTREMKGIWFDHRLQERFREEAPGAYKPIADVMRAQRELVRIERRLSPLLVYKGA